MNRDRKKQTEAREREEGEDGGRRGGREREIEKTKERKNEYFIYEGNGISNSVCRCFSFLFCLVFCLVFYIQPSPQRERERAKVEGRVRVIVMNSMKAKKNNITMCLERLKCSVLVVRKSLTLYVLQCRQCFWSWLPL